MSHVNCVRRSFQLLVAIVLMGASGAKLSAAVGTLADSSGEAVGWGSNVNGQIAIPAGDFTAIAGGSSHSLGIKTDGTLVGWGTNINGQSNPQVGTFTAVAAGLSHSLGLRTDGTLIGWGSNINGQIDPQVGTFKAVAAPANSSYSLGIKSDGTLVGWGFNGSGQTTVPAGTLTAVAAGASHSLAIRSDGTLIDWGGNNFGQIDNTPTGTFTAIAGGGRHSLTIRSEGTLEGWGDNNFGQTSVPTGTFTAVAAGNGHSLGIKSDGTLAGWGFNGTGQTTVPAGTFVVIAAGDFHSLALRARTEYDGDLLVSYPGPPALHGPNGLKAGLNRSINVAGDARIESPMFLYNNPVMNVAGKIVFSTPGGHAHAFGAGTINAGGGLEFLGFTSLGIPFADRLVVNSAGPLMGNGNLYLGEGARLTAALSQDGSFQGELTINNSALSFTGIGFINPAALAIHGESELRLSAGQRVQVDGIGVNHGRIELLGNPNLFGGAAEIEFGDAIINYPDGFITGRDTVMRFGDVAGEVNGLMNQGSLALTRGTSDLFGDVENTDTGSIVITGGAFATFYDDVIQNGTLRVSKAGSTTSSAVFLGSFTGSGGSTGGGDIFFEGDLRPGNSPAIVNFGGNVSLGDQATLEIELGGLTPGTQYDQVHVAGALSLGGALDVSLINGFTPAVGNSFDILDWGSLDGTFNSLNLPTLPGRLYWITDELYTTGVLNVAKADAIARWLAATSGDWSTATRWDIGVVPNNSGTDLYDARIEVDGSYTVTLDENPIINKFTLDAAGATFFASGRTFTVAGDTSLREGTVHWRGSTWNGLGTITNSTLFINTGSSTISSPFLNAGTLSLRGEGSLGFAELKLGPSFTNVGTVELRNEDPRIGWSVFLTQTSGTFLNSAGGTITTEQGPGAAGGFRSLNIATLENGIEAVVNIHVDSGFTQTDGQFNNAGALNVAAGRQFGFFNGSDLTQAGGTIRLADGANIYLNHAGGIYSQSGGSIVMDGDAFIHGDGGSTFTFNGGSIDTSASTRTDGHVFVRAGNLNFGNATPVTGPATFYVTGVSNLTGNVPAGMTVRVAGSPTFGFATLNAANDTVNHGTLQLANDAPTVDFSAFFAMPAGKTLANVGTIEVINGTGPVNGANRRFDAAVNNAGTIQVSSSTPAVFARDLAQKGTFNIATGSAASVLGNFSGDGGTTGSGTLVVEGRVQPGPDPAIVHFGGTLDFGPAAALEIDLGGTTPGTGYDQIHVAGSLALDGTLRVSLIDGFQPAAGNVFDILDWGSLVGTFDTLELPALTGSHMWGTAQLYSSGVLAVTAPGVAGDYNQNGTVDTADYVVWRKNVGTTDMLPNDPIGGLIGQAHFNQWRANFGTTAGSGSLSDASVPEPAGAWLLIFGAVIEIWRGRRIVSRDPSNRKRVSCFIRRPFRILPSRRCFSGEPV